VGINLLHNMGELHHRAGRITVGVLVAQDLLMIPMLIAINSMGRRGGPDYSFLLEIGGAVLFLFLLVFFLSRREKLRIPFAEEIGRDMDAGPVAAVAFCLVMAALSSLAGLSASYGAFIAGLILGASTLRANVLQVSTPLQSILMTIFFLSIGLMVDVAVIFAYLPVVLVLLVAVHAGKTVINVVVLRLLKITPREAVIASVTMAQVGEFSFVLAAAGLSAGAISESGYQVALAVIALSLIASPLWMLTARRIVDHKETSAGSVLELLDEVFEFELAAFDRCRTALRRWLPGRRRKGPGDNNGSSGN
ncbi:MAG: cation:proton antiporter, partial [Alphaproteobacteria bacterium]